MRCAAIFSNLITRAWEQYGIDRYSAEILHTANVKYLAAGSYTLAATLDPDPEVGKDIKCYARGMENDGTVWTYPATGESALPTAFDVSEVSDVRFFFGYEGFRDVLPGEGDPIAADAVTAVKCGETGKPDRDIYESAVMHPDEIAGSDVMAQAISSKSSTTLQILPAFEVWGFCVRGATLVRIIDLDRTQNRTIFKGRVSAVSDIMENGGAVRQTVTCVSAADFLEDTAIADGISPQSLSDWLAARCAAHNGQVELARRYTFAVSGSAAVSSGSDYLCKTNFEALNEVLTGEKYLTENGGVVKYEWLERYQNDVAHIDIASKLGMDKDTPFEIGENLTGITIEYDLDGGVYTSVMVISGVNSDGFRATATAANGAMVARYGNGRQRVIVNDDIYFAGSGGREYVSGNWTWHETPATEAMKAALQAYANQEAAKLSEPPIKIMLTAADLAAMGLTGYEPFEVGNNHPLVYPPGGYFGQRVRITGIKRRLSDGRIEQITIAKGQQPGGKHSSGSLSAQMARLSAANSAADDSKMIGILNETTGGLTFDPLTQAEFDDLSEKDDNTIYYVDDDGDISIYKGDTHISTGGGGGDEPTIETAAVLTSEQMQTWAPQHALVPVEFRGSAMVYYAQAPARVVIQGQRALFGVNDGMVSGDDIMSEVIYDYPDGARQKIKAFIREMTATSVSIAAAYYDVSGAAETRLGYTTNYRVNIPYGWQSLKVGIAIHVQNYYLNEDDEFAASIQAKLYIFINGSLGAAGQLIGAKYSGGQITTVGIEFGSAAERGFASGISRRTEPAYPNSVEEGDSE